jgi:hypothetical protein
LRSNRRPKQTRQKRKLKLHLLVTRKQRSPEPYLILRCTPIGDQYRKRVRAAKLGHFVNRAFAIFSSQTLSPILQRQLSTIEAWDCASTGRFITFATGNLGSSGVQKNNSANCWLTADAAGSTLLLLHSYPTCSASIETDPPSTPSTGNATRSEGVRVPITYRSGT